MEKTTDQSAVSGLDLIVEFNLKPGVIDDFEAILLPHLANVADEAACLLMSASRGLDDKNHYTLFERWADKNEFWNVEMKRDYRAAFNEKIAPLQAVESKVTFYDPTFFKSKN